MDQNQMMLEYLMEMGALQPQQEKIAQKRAMVQQLRQGGQMPGMRQMPRSGGGVIARAAHPLEFLASLGSTGLGEYQDQQANQMQDQYGTDRRMGLENLRTRMGRVQPAAAGGGMRPMDTADYGGGI